MPLNPFLLVDQQLYHCLRPDTTSHLLQLGIIPGFALGCRGYLQHNCQSILLNGTTSFSKLAGVHSESPGSHYLSGVKPDSTQALVTFRKRRPRRTAPFNYERRVEMRFSGVTLAFDPARVSCIEPSDRTQRRYTTAACA